jgi:hypothetical protein
MRGRSASRWPARAAFCPRCHVPHARTCAPHPEALYSYRDCIWRTIAAVAVSYSLGSVNESLSVKLDAEAVHFPPNHGTELHFAVPAQFNFLGYGYRIEHAEHGTSSGNIAHGAVDDRGALVKDNFPGFEHSPPFGTSFVCDRLVLPHCTYCPPAHHTRGVTSSLDSRARAWRPFRLRASIILRSSPR